MNAPVLKTTLACLALCAAGTASAQLFDEKEMAKWSNAEVVHYEIVGEFSRKQVQIPPTDADLYADVTERVRISLDWNRTSKKIVGTPKIINEPGTLAKITGLDAKCPAGKVNGPYEHFDVSEIRPMAGMPETLELIGKRIHPETQVAESCSSKLRRYKGAVKPVTEFIGIPDAIGLAIRMNPAQGGVRLSPDFKSIVVSGQNSSWVWTFTPTTKP